jgi:hypothetical protein
MKYDTRPIQQRIVAYLEQSTDGTRQRRLVRRAFQNVDDFRQGYQELISQGIIKEQGIGKKNNPVLTILCQIGHTIASPQPKIVRTTRQRVINFLINTKDHAASKRDILKHLSYLKDFQETYQAMLEDKTIEEYGQGRKTSAKMVCLCYQFVRTYNG